MNENEMTNEAIDALRREFLLQAAMASAIGKAEARAGVLTLVAWSLERQAQERGLAATMVRPDDLLEEGVLELSWPSLPTEDLASLIGLFALYIAADEPGYAQFFGMHLTRLIHEAESREAAV